MKVDNISDQHPSYDERLKNYQEVRKRIFEDSIPKKVQKLREMRKSFKDRKIASNELNAVSINFSDNRPHAIVNLEGKRCVGLLDSGASISALGENSVQFLKDIDKRISKIRKAPISTADGTALTVLGFVNLQVTYKGVSKLHKFFVIPSLSKTLYLGYDFWKAFKIAPELHKSFQICDLDLDVVTKEDVKFHNLTPEERIKLEKVKNLFPSYLVHGLGHTTYVQHTIDTGSVEPIKSKQYQVSPKVQELIYEELDRMLHLGVIEESESPWNSPVVLVRKPGKNRLCLDSRKLNSVTKKMAYALPNINSLLSRLADTVFISAIDLKDAFWQIELDSSSREKTAFSVPGRPHYQFRVMCFGLCNAAQRLSQLMDKVVPTSLRDRVFVYLDDLLVVSKNFSEHITLLTEVANRLNKAGLTINISKSRFCCKESKYLGHIVGYGVIKPDPEKVVAIKEFKVPTTTKEIRRFIGMIGYYAKFIDNYSGISGPLTELIRKSQKFVMTSEALNAFQTLKAALISEPILVHPDFSKPFFVHCDASKWGVGACLMQQNDQGEDQAICYFSKKLNRAQRNYSVTELECYAAVLAIEKFRPYLELQEFTVITDHSSLRWLMSLRDLSGRLARWSLRLQRYNFSIEHRKGHLNVVYFHTINGSGCKRN